MMQLTPDHVLVELQQRVGADRGIHVRELVQRMTGQLLSNAPLERRVRAIVAELRMQGHAICAHPSKGYFLAADGDELNSTCNFLYARAMSSLTQISRMKRLALPDLRGQLQLPPDSPCESPEPTPTGEP